MKNTRANDSVDIGTPFRHTPIQGVFVARHPKPSAKNATGEYAAFEDALKKVLSVPKSKLDAEKRKKIRRPSASHVVNGADH